MYQEQITYPIEYDSIHKDCEQDIWAYYQQLQHVKTYAPTIVRERKDELINHLLELCQYVEDL